MKKTKSVPTDKQSLFGQIKETWKGKRRATKKANTDQNIYGDT